VLDYSARQATLGKTVGDDFKEGKISLPVILAFRRGDDDDRAFWRRTLEDLDQAEGDLEHAIHLMEKHGAPTRIIVPGKVFRNEATDATHEAQFYQLEGLAVGEDVTLAHLKGTLERFCKEYFGSDAKIRLRPSYFPFTEPSVEVDVWFPKQQKWLEVMGAGMVHPAVLQNAGVDAKKYQGFAFGLGVERFVMIKYGIPDIRLFHSGDIRFNYAFNEKPV